MRHIEVNNGRESAILNLIELQGISPYETAHPVL